STRAVALHPFLSYSLGNLAIGNVAIEQTAPGLEVSERGLKEGLFDEALVRNTDTHGRPGANSEMEGAYRRAVADVAARYSEVDASGRFAFRSEHTISVTDDAGVFMGEVRVRNLLARAGLAFLPDPGAATARYRFGPFWVHAHLIERKHQRMVEGYRYQTCE